MNSEITKNVLEKLRSIKEKRCNRYGYVSEVTALVDFQSGEIRPEDLSADPVFEVKFNCIICVPQEGHILVAQVQRMNDSIICIENGPIQIIVQHDHISSDVFDVNGDVITHRMTGERVIPGTMVKIKVLSRKFLVYDTSIKILGYLEGIASQDDIDRCYHDTNSDTSTSLRNKMILKAMT